MIFPNYSLPYSWFAKSILKRVLWPHIVEKYGVEKFHTFFFPFWEFLFVGLFVCNMGYPRTMTMLARILSIWSNKHFFFFNGGTYWSNLLGNVGQMMLGIPPNLQLPATIRCPLGIRRRGEAAKSWMGQMNWLQGHLPGTCAMTDIIFLVFLSLPLDLKKANTGEESRCTPSHWLCYIRSYYMPYLLCWVVFVLSVGSRFYWNSHDLFLLTLKWSLSLSPITLLSPVKPWL